MAGLLSGADFYILPPDQGNGAKILFKTDGTFEGTSGFNVIAGTWTAGRVGRNTKRTFRVTATRTTRMAAPNDTARNFENTFFEALSKTRALQEDGENTLILLDERDTILARFIFSRL